MISERKEKFELKGNGKSYFAEATTTLISTGGNLDLNSPSEERKRSYKLEDGRELIKKRDKFVIVDTGEELVRVT